MNPNSPNIKTNKRQTIVGFASKVLKLCLRIKIFVQMLEKEVFSEKFRTMTLNTVKVHKSFGCADFQNYPERFITVSNMDGTYEPFRKINKIKRFLKQVKLVKNITLNSIKLMRIFKVTMLSLNYVEKNRRTRNKLKIKVFIANRGFCRQILIGLTDLL